MIKAKAALLYAPKVIRVREIDLPDCGPNEVIVNLKKATLCPTDIKKYNALKPGVENSLREIGPYILGHEAAGIILEIGEKVKNVKVGDHVAIQPMISCNTCCYCLESATNMCQNLIGIGGSAGDFRDCVQMFYETGVGGCFATHLKAPSTCVIRLPKGISLEAGSLLEPLADVVNSVDSAGVNSNDDVVIIGLGPMGLFHVVVANYYGARSVHCIDIDETRLAIAKQLGANAVVNSKTADPVSEILEKTNQLGASKIFVTAGGLAQGPCTRQALQMARKKGIVSLFASADNRADKIEINMNNIHYNMIKLTGTVGFNHEHAQEALNILSSNIFEPSIIRNLEFPLSKITDAIESYGKGVNLKVGLDLER